MTLINKLVKKLLGILVLGLFICTAPSQADDISDFEIEGMSIGDSLLEYFTEQEIEDHIVDSYYQYIKVNKGKFLGVEFIDIPRLEVYEALQFAIKKNDQRYKIYMVKGMIRFKENINDCYEKLNDIDKDLSELFKNLSREKYNGPHPADPSGKSTINSINYWFPTNDLIEIECYDWSEEKGYIDHLRIGATTDEFNSWLNNEG